MEMVNLWFDGKNPLRIHCNLDKPQNSINKQANTHASCQYIKEEKGHTQAIKRNNFASTGLLKVFSRSSAK